MKVDLNKTQLRVAIDAIESALAGDATEGDFCWSEREISEARKASEKFKEARDRAIATAERKEKRNVELTEEARARLNGKKKTVVAYFGFNKATALWYTWVDSPYFLQSATTLDVAKRKLNETLSLRAHVDIKEWSDFGPLTE